MEDINTYQPQLRYRAVYLAGPIDKCTYEEMHEWREQAKIFLDPIKCFDPTRRHFEFADTNPEAYEKEVVTLDKAEISASDAVLVWYNPPAAGGRMTGTTMEIIHAFEKGKLVVVVSSIPVTSTWVTYHSHRRFLDLGEACSYIKSFYR